MDADTATDTRRGPFDTRRGKQEVRDRQIPDFNGSKPLPPVVHLSATTPCRGVAAKDQLNESPQAQEPVAFGLSIVKPCFSMVSTKSIEAPWM